MTVAPKRDFSLNSRKLLVLLAAGLLLAAAGFGFGYLAIQMNQQKSLLGWTVQANPVAGPADLRPGHSSVAELQARFGNANVELLHTDGRLELTYPELRFGSDRVRLVVTLNVSDEQLAALMLASAAEVPGPELLERGTLDAEKILELRLDPSEPLDHERVLYSYGRPKLTMALPAESGEPGDTVWLYPRKGLMVIFSDQQATRFRFGQASSGLSGSV